ncbi:helix-turn-helix transcriptional regulator [Pseudomonas putida]|nr:helix-turn-helix transcriptional regulator [Pseudomonas putida]
MLIADGVSERLREERDRKGLTQLDFATLIGVSRGTQKNYEVGAAVGAMDLKYLAALEANGVDATYVLTGQRTVAAGLTGEEFTILEHYRAISAEDQRSIRRFLKAMFDDSRKPT